MLLVFLIGIYLGGVVASAPMAMKVRRSGALVFALVGLGWPVLLVGMATGLVSLRGGVVES